MYCLHGASTQPFQRSRRTPSPRRNRPQHSFCFNPHMRINFKALSLAKAKFLVLWLSSSLAFLGALYLQLSSRQFDGLAVVAASALALLFSFSALLFNRSRAFPSGPIQRRTLLAAEYAASAAIYFMIGVVISLIVGTGLWYSKGGNLTQLRGFDFLLVLVTPIVFVISSFREFFVALQIVQSQLQRRRISRAFLRGLR